MPKIPSEMEGVTIEFGDKVNGSVDSKVISALKHMLAGGKISTHKIEKIYISSANDQHVLPSRHVQGQGKAVDISRINGKKMSVYYPGDPEVKAITEGLQTRFETFVHRRENFGPFMKYKNGSSHPVSGHTDHIHISVN
ncbi:hypothetical protein [Bacterioplanoides sp.]|uniref:hypothetical protein n=1 Tax=Bacterioplanoides sp. TaxID=2066072 RepID=UPI003B001866